MSPVQLRRPLAKPGAPPRTVTVAGELDLATIGTLRDILHAHIAAGHVRLVVDLNKVGLCDAAAMSGLVRLSRRCARHGGWLRLAHPTGIVAVALRIVSFGLDVEVYPTVRAAIAGDPDARIMR
jgi:anti-anti-sigma factor